MKKGVKDARKRTARERIRELFEQAERRPEYARRYMQLVDRLKKRYRVRLTPEQRRRVCKKCLAFLRPGKNCTVRTKDGRIVIKCLECGHVQRYPFLRERRSA